MDVSRLPRPIGFVLGGGGSLGAMQIGMLQAVAECGVAPDIVVGTSVGSLNGAAVAFDPVGAANRLSHYWPRVTGEMVFPGGLIGQARTLQRTKTHLFPNTGLAAVLGEFLSEDTTFADLKLPFGAVVLNVATARPQVLSEGPLLPALLASCAVPGVFPPVVHGELRLYDGGVVANVPMRQAIAMGARSLVVLECGFPGQTRRAPETLAEVLLYTAMVAMHSQAELEARLVATEVPVVYLPGPTPRYISPLDFSHTRLLIPAAYETARSFLEQVDITGPGLYASQSG